MELKDFPIMCLYECKNVSKRKDGYILDLHDWKTETFINRLKVKTVNKEKLKNIIYIAFTNNPNYDKNEKNKAKSKIEMLKTRI